MSSPQPREDWPRVARYIERRVEDELGLQWKDIPARGGPSTAKVREIVNGTSRVLKPSLRRDLEHALEWPPKAFDVILAGGEPSIPPAGKALNRMEAPELVTALEDLVREFRRRIMNNPEDWPPDWVPSQG
jgi:hypothetical protein